MTIIEMRHFLFANAASRFSLPLADIKDRLGEPASIRFLPSGLERDKKNIAVFSYLADDGAVDLYCPVMLRDHAEWAVDGWIMVEQAAAGINGKSIGPTLVKRNCSTT